MTIKAFRAGETARTWSDDPNDETLSCEIDYISVRFSMPSKGGGVTEVDVRITPDSFGDFAKAMVTVESAAAIRAFGAALAGYEKSN